jgi:ABC-2 type transport system ATP-binding protein
VVNQGRLVLEDEIAALRAGTGLVRVSTPDADRAIGLLDGRVTARDGDLLMVRHDDPAALNALLVGQGLRVAELGEARRTLEEVVLEVTSAGSDRVAGG